MNYRSNNNSYKSISHFGKNKTAVNNPLTYCIDTTYDQRFNHGGNSSVYGQSNKACQAFLSDYCAKNWDGFCEVASQNKNVDYPNNLAPCNSKKPCSQVGMNQGEILIRNTAAKKYLTSMGNCQKIYQPFDPTVADSPMIYTWESNYECVPEYEVDPNTIDQDIVMNKMLMNPKLYSDIFINMFNTMKRKGTLMSLEGTRLGDELFFRDPFFVSKLEN